MSTSRGSRASEIAILHLLLVPLCDGALRKARGISAMLRAFALPLGVTLINTLHLALRILHRLLGSLLPRGTGRHRIRNDEFVPHHFRSCRGTPGPAWRV